MGIKPGCQGWGIPGSSKWSIQQSPRNLEHGGAGIGKDLLKELSWDWEGPNIHRAETGRNSRMSSLGLPSVLSPNQRAMEGPWGKCWRSRSSWESAPGCGAESGCGGHQDHPFIPGDLKSLPEPGSGAGSIFDGHQDNPIPSSWTIPSLHSRIPHPCLH